MTRLSKLTVVLVSLYIALNGCALEDTVLSLSTVTNADVISNDQQGAEAASAVIQARELAVSSNRLFVNLGQIGMGVMDPSLPGMGTDLACTDGGTYNYTGTYTAETGSYALIFTFSGCRESGYQYAGTYKLSGTPTNITVVLGDSAATFNLFNFNSSYSVLLAYMKASLSFSMTGSGTESDAVYALTTNGSITNFDYFLLNNFSMLFSSFKANYTISTDAVTGDQSTSVLVNGYFGESCSRFNFTARFSDFAVDTVKRFNRSAGSFYDEYTSVYGNVFFDFRPNTFCFEGSYTVDTPVPVHKIYSSGLTDQGTLIINGNTTTEYNSGGDIAVTVAGTAPVTYAAELDLKNICNFSALEQDIPVMRLTGTTTGDTMTITLSWFNEAGVSHSDMDLHLNYYDTTAPTSSSVITWVVDWHGGSTCSDPADFSFIAAVDIDAGGSGTCDVGLDFDNTHGYGPEHITALKLPVGYYVVSVNSYGLHGDASATNYLTVSVGDSLFGAYAHTFETSGGEGTDPDTWFRVADVRVNADGTVDVLTPNSALNPWHR